MPKTEPPAIPSMSSTTKPDIMNRKSSPKVWISFWSGASRDWWRTQSSTESGPGFSSLRRVSGSANISEKVWVFTMPSHISTAQGTPHTCTSWMMRSPESVNIARTPIRLSSSALPSFLSAPSSGRGGA